MNGQTLKVLAPGTRVIIGDDIHALVTQVLISADNHIQYQCSWWDGRQRNLEWLEAEECAANESAERVGIGFASPT